MENTITRKNIKVKDPISALTHFIGFLMCIPVLIALVQKAATEGSSLKVMSLVIFGASLLLLYGASTVYHTLNISEKSNKLLKRIDHMMIFVLIAGTYTPVCLGPLNGSWGYTLLALVWGIAFAGVILKALWINAPRILSTAIYVIMGWIVVIAFMPLKQAVPMAGIALLVAGGVTYTLGAVIYALKWPKFNFQYFGFHEIFHLFVMGGTLFHVIFMFLYVL